MKKILSLLTVATITINTTSVVVSCDRKLLEATNLDTWASSIDLQAELESRDDQTHTSIYSFVGEQNPQDLTENINLKYDSKEKVDAVHNSFLFVVSSILANGLGKDVGDNKNWFTQSSSDISVNKSWSLENILAYFNYSIIVDGASSPLENDYTQALTIAQGNEIHLEVTFDTFANWTNGFSLNADGDPVWANADTISIGENKNKFTGTATFDIVVDWLN